MELIWIGLCLFSFVLSTVTLTGYLFFLRPAAAARHAAAQGGAALQEPAAQATSIPPTALSFPGCAFTGWM